MGGGLLNDPLAVGQAEELALDAVSFYGKGVFYPNIPLPRHGTNAFKESIKIGSGTGTYLKEKALGETKIDIQAWDGVEGRYELDASVDGLGTGVAKGVDLLANEFFKAEKAGSYKGLGIRHGGLLSNGY
jgi:hypothetical protein